MRALRITRPGNRSRTPFPPVYSLGKREMTCLSNHRAWMARSGPNLIYRSSPAFTRLARVTWDIGRDGQIVHALDCFLMLPSTRSLGWCAMPETRPAPFRIAQSHQPCTARHTPPWRATRTLMVDPSTTRAAIVTADSWSEASGIIGIRGALFCF
jgi:hypothetical protein